jgi:hypothetical protein
MEKNLKFKNKKGHIGFVGAAVVVLAGGWYLLGSPNVSLPQQSVDDDKSGNLDVYLSTLTSADGNYTITSTGTGKSTSYIIEVDKDNIASDGTLTLTTGFTQILPDGVNIDSNQVQPHTLTIPFSSDILVHDSANEEYPLVDVSSSTIDGNKGSVQKTFTAATEVSVSTALNMNSQSFDLTTATELDDVGEYKEYSLKFGQSNSAILKVKN